VTHSTTSPSVFSILNFPSAQWIRLVSSCYVFSSHSSCSLAHGLHYWFNLFFRPAAAPMRESRRCVARDERPGGVQPPIASHHFFQPFVFSQCFPLVKISLLLASRFIVLSTNTLKIASPANVTLDVHFHEHFFQLVARK